MLSVGSSLKYFNVEWSHLMGKTLLQFAKYVTGKVRTEKIVLTNPTGQTFEKGNGSNGNTKGKASMSIFLYYRNVRSQS